MFGESRQLFSFQVALSYCLSFSAKQRHIKSYPRVPLPRGSNSRGARVRWPISSPAEPGAPPVSSRAMTYFLAAGCRGLTPAPPFSSMNSTPAASSARRTARSFETVIDVAFSANSARRIVVTPNAECRAKSSALHRKSARAALICALVSIFDAGDARGGGYMPTNFRTAGLSAAKAAAWV